MKALFFENINQPLKIKEVEIGLPGENEVLVQIKSAALNHRDLWIQKGQYAGIVPNVILGSDGAGIVTDVGKNVEKSWIGKEVIINPGLEWGENINAHAKEFKILGMPGHGTFSEFVKVPVSCLHIKPSHLNFHEAAALPLAGLTAYRALFTRAQYTGEEKLLINGIGGGVALTVLQFAAKIGKKIYFTSGSEEKIVKAKQLGGLEGINYKLDGWEKEIMLKTGGGFDIIIDSAAGEGFAKLIDISNVGGKIVFYGGTCGPIKEIIPGRAFWKQISILGTTMGSKMEFESMLQFVNLHKIVPVVDEIIDFHNFENAFKKMDTASQFGKIVLLINNK